MNEIVLGSVLFVAIVLILSSIVVAARALLLPSGTIRVTVNGATGITGRAGSKLLDILADAGIQVPAACGGKGTCGQCRVVVTEGGGVPLQTETAKLTRGEIGHGLRLSCQLTARRDIAVSLPEGILGAATWSCRVLSNRPLSPLIREIVLELPPGGALDFRPGAFVQVTAPPYQLRFADFEIAPEHRQIFDRFELREMASASDVPVSRAYSIANTPADQGRIVLLVRLALPPPTVASAPPGVVSSYLFALKPGDVVEAAGPYGEFAARESGREMVFIGGGVGMAPLRAIIYDQLERLETSRRISFWYGARSRIDLFYIEAFDALQARHPNFRWTPALSEPVPHDRWDGATGFIHDVVRQRYLADHPAPEDCEYYLCGPPLMIKAVRVMLDELGIDPKSIFFDDFGGSA